MNFTPFLTADLIIKLHACAASIALILGPIAIYQKRKSMAHKLIGYVWVLAMASTAISAFGIHSFAVIWGLSPIHGLALLALWSLWTAMKAIFEGNVAHHKAVMQNLYWHGLCFAGLFNFLPGRIVNRTLFDDSRHAGFAVIAIGIGLIAARSFQTWRKSRQINV